MRTDQKPQKKPFFQRAHSLTRTPSPASLPSPPLGYLFPFCVIALSAETYLPIRVFQ